ncbi:MAG: acetolactate synthase small subunit [Candidatus Solincola sediminis]|uniref:Acetolactate synthase small subunit n=1 Tax=Candidatus Solincola sediminis TaxID=1797199 RepID=A0A1F2WH42_9ACTN|nr:MAG: acetolactate synthase small subunit [Candidatus Solincola sediminis]OFW60419.1 MAG: acetolactate synthase small subunit [Candidatus Solincola sediminis]
MKHTLSVLVENKPGVLARVAELFARRGFNIDSLAVGTTEKPDISRMTIVVDVEEHSLEQVRKQLHKLINIIEIIDLDPDASVAREMVLAKIRVDADNRSEVIEIVDIFRGNIVDVSRESIVVEVTGNASKLRAFEDLLKPYGIRELVRTGKVALPRGK